MEKIAASEGVAPSNRSSSRPQRAGVSLPWSRNRWRRSRADKPRQRLQKPISGENHSVFWSKSVVLPDHSRTCVSHTSSPDLVDEIWIGNQHFFFKHFFMTRAMPIMHQWNATGRDMRSNGLAEGHNGIFISGQTYFQPWSSGTLSKVRLRRDKRVG